MKNSERIRALAAEAEDWEARRLDPRAWEDAPEAIPRAGESTLISIRIPNRLLAALRALARRGDVGYQVLIKRWLDERLQEERRQLAATRHPAEPALAPEFPLRDRATGKHLEASCT